MTRLALVRQCFRDFDCGDKGWLTKQDLKLAMSALLGFRPTKFEVEYILGCAGEEKDGVDEALFTRVMLDKLSKIDEDDMLRQMFCAFDVGCRGFLTLQDLVKVFHSVSPGLSLDAIEECFRYADLDGDGRVGYGDFCRVMKLQ